MNMHTFMQALVDLCCVAITKCVELTGDFRLPTDIRQTLQRYKLINSCPPLIYHSGVQCKSDQLLYFGLVD